MLLTLAVSACGPIAVVNTTASAATSSNGALAGQAALQVFPQGFSASGNPLRNGAGVSLAPDLRVEVFVDPYPATGSTVWLDLLLLQDGTPVDTADVSSDNTMAYMSHGTTHQQSTSSGDGHYLFALSYPMVGPWQHLIHIGVEDQRFDLPLVITVYPS